MFVYRIPVYTAGSIALVHAINLAANWFVSCFCVHGLGKEAVAAAALAFALC